MLFLILYVLGGLLTYFLGTLIKGEKWCTTSDSDDTPMLRTMASIFWLGYVVGFIPVMFVARRLYRLAFYLRETEGWCRIAHRWTLWQHRESVAQGNKSWSTFYCQECETERQVND